MRELKTEDLLFVVYFENPGGMTTTGRYIESAFTSKGLIDFDEVNLDDFLSLQVTDSRVGPIDTHEDLVKFSYYLSETMNKNGVCLCDAEATNRAMQNAKTTSMLHQCLIDEGDILENPEKKNKGFFSRLVP